MLECWVAIRYSMGYGKNSLPVARSYWKMKLLAYNPISQKSVNFLWHCPFKNAELSWWVVSLRGVIRNPHLHILANCVCVHVPCRGKKPRCSFFSGPKIKWSRLTRQKEDRVRNAVQTQSSSLCCVLYSVQLLFTTIPTFYMFFSGLGKRSFAFLIKECFVLNVLFRSL